VVDLVRWMLALHEQESESVQKVSLGENPYLKIPIAVDAPCLIASAAIGWWYLPEELTSFWVVIYSFF
jgi:hypothetical protein